MDYDIIIIGAGSAGLAAAISLADTGLKLAVIDKQPLHSIAEPILDGREIAISAATKRILTELGIWQYLDISTISSIEQAKILNGDAPYALHFDARAVNSGSLGYLVAHHLLRKAIYTASCKQDNLTIFTDSAVTKVSTSSTGAQLEINGSKQLRAQLIIVADGRFSHTRSSLGIAATSHSIGRSVIVANMQLEQEHDNIAYECFHYGRTLAILPLCNQQVSVVITLATNRVQQLLEMSVQDFNQDIEQAFEQRLGPMQLVTQRYSYPLVMSYAEQFVGTKCALIGDAAVGMHPVTAHGFNFGIQGQDCLTGLIKNAHISGQDIAASTLLQQYNAKHQRATKPLYLATNALVKLYTSEKVIAKCARKGLLRLGNIIRPANRFLVRKLTKG
jgi:ubiquinone biosynthesis UbiH/UbiF/VisC/COQ6 family hydroxylase